MYLSTMLCYFFRGVYSQTMSMPLCFFPFTCLANYMQTMSEAAWSDASNASDVPPNWTLVNSPQVAYEIFYHPYKFTAFVRREQGLFKVLVGREVPCVYISVYDSDSSAYIHAFKHDEQCGETVSNAVRTASHSRSTSTLTPLPPLRDPPRRASLNAFRDTSPQQINSDRDDGTIYGLISGTGTIALFKATCMLVFDLFPNVKAITFKDTSTVKSHVKKDVEISLPALYMVKHGQTWYQAKFGAYPKMRAVEAKRLAARIERMQLERLPTNFDNFFDQHIKLHMKSAYIKRGMERVRALFRPWYESSSSLPMFVHKILSQLDCIMLAGWLDKYVHDKVEWDVDMLWILSRDILVQWERRSWKKTPLESAAYPYGRDTELEDHEIALFHGLSVGTGGAARPRPTARVGQVAKR